MKNYKKLPIILSAIALILSGCVKNQPVSNVPSSETSATSVTSEQVSSSDVVSSSSSAILLCKLVILSTKFPLSFSFLFSKYPFSI